MNGLRINKKLLFNSINNSSLKSMLKYLMSLKDNGTISQEQYQNLVELSCSIYLENKIEQLFNDNLEKVGLYFFNDDRLVEYFNSPIFAAAQRLGRIIWNKEITGNTKMNR